jgi:hypothetical protein
MSMIVQRKRVLFIKHHFIPSAPQSGDRASKTFGKVIYIVKPEKDSLMKAPPAPR